MTARQFFNVFDIPPAWYFKSKKKNVWAQVIRQFEQWPLERVLEKKKSIYKDEAGPWYYVEAVRRQLTLEDDAGYKRAPIAPAMKDILRRMAL